MMWHAATLMVDIECVKSGSRWQDGAAVVSPSDGGERPSHSCQSGDVVEHAGFGFSFLLTTRSCYGANMYPVIHTEWWTCTRQVTTTVLLDSRTSSWDSPGFGKREGTVSDMRDVFISQLFKVCWSQTQLNPLTHAQTAAIRRPASLPVLPVTLHMRPLALSMPSLCRRLLPDSAHLHLPDGWSASVSVCSDAQRSRSPTL